MKRTALLIALAAAGLAGTAQAADGSAHDYLVRSGLADNPVQATNVREAEPAEPTAARAVLVDAGLAEAPVARYTANRPVAEVELKALNPTARYIIEAGGLDLDALRLAPKS